MEFVTCIERDLSVLGGGRSDEGREGAFARTVSMLEVSCVCDEARELV